MTICALGRRGKQWGRHPSELGPEVTARIPLRTNFDDRYFSDRYQVRADTCVFGGVGVRGLEREASRDIERRKSSETERQREREERESGREGGRESERERGVGGGGRDR